MASLLGMAAMSLMPRRALAQTTARDHGAIKPPLPAPEMTVVRHDGVSTTLARLLDGHVTAVQLMFASCTTTCPIQGAIFARVQTLLPGQVERGIQLLSLSVDPQHDTPLVLKRWLHRFKGRAGWVAAAPPIGDVERLRDFAGRGPSPSDNHSTQIQIFNRQGLLVWRTGPLPDAEEIASLLRKFSPATASGTGG